VFSSATPARSTPHRRLAALLLAGGLGLALPVLVAGSAVAHDRLESSDPAADSTVASAPAQIVLTMSATPLALGTQVQVSMTDGGSDGTVVSEGDPQIVDSTVTQPLREDRPAGTYEVQWRVTSSDGHPISGSFAFTATEAVGAPSPTGTETGTTTQTPDEPAATSPATIDPSNPVQDSENGLLIGIGIAAVAVIGAVGGVIGYRRRQR